MNYVEFKKEMENEMNEFTDGKIFFAFGSTEKEVINKLKQQGIKHTEVIGIGAGTYILKDQYENVIQFFDKQAKKQKQYTMKHLKEVLKHEFADYELEISLSYTYTTFMKTVIGLTENEIKENQNEIREAIEEYKEEFYKYN